MDGDLKIRLHFTIPLNIFTIPLNIFTIPLDIYNPFKYLYNPFEYLWFQELWFVSDAAAKQELKFKQWNGRLVRQLPVRFGS